jgi:hypothetical protein
MLGVAIVPLVTLTAMAFVSGGGRTGAASYEPAELADLEAVRDSTRATLAKLPAEEASATEDPAGFSADGAPSGSVSLPYEVSKQLVEAERASKSNDIELVRQTKKSLETLIADKLVEVEKLRPRGDSLAEAIRQRSQATARHEVWLSKRAIVHQTLASAAAAMANGPEIDGEKKCLDLLGQLQKDLPADALTPEEAEAVSRLKSRARFRGKFLTARRSTAAKSEKVSELKSELDAWDEFLKLYATRGAPDGRDTAFLEEAKGLRRTAELNWRWALALNQPSASGLVAKVDDWLRAATTAKGDHDQHKQQAAGLVRVWLENNVPPVPQKPKGLEDVKEGFTDPANKRKLGFFKQVPQTEKQYYFWTNKAQVKIKVKGEEQFNLQTPPSEPAYLAMLADYDICRDAFLRKGYQTAEATAQFREDCARVGEQHAKYRTNYAEPGNPIDAAAKGWAEEFERAKKIAAELIDPGNKPGLWELLAIPSSR